VCEALHQSTHLMFGLLQWEKVGDAPNWALWLKLLAAVAFIHSHKETGIKPQRELFSWCGFYVAAHSIWVRVRACDSPQRAHISPIVSNMQNQQNFSLPPLWKLDILNIALNLESCINSVNTTFYVVVLPWEIFKKNYFVWWSIFDTN